MPRVSKTTFLVSWVRVSIRSSIRILPVAYPHVHIRITRGSYDANAGNKGRPLYSK